MNILSSPLNGDGQINFQNTISDETKILSLQPHSGSNVNDSNVNYYHHQSNRTTPHYRSTNEDDSHNYEVANF